MDSNPVSGTSVRSHLESNLRRKFGLITLSIYKTKPLHLKTSKSVKFVLKKYNKEIKITKKGPSKKRS